MEILTEKPLSEVTFSTATLSHTTSLPFEGRYYLVSDPRLEEDSKSDSAEKAAKLVLGKHCLLTSMRTKAQRVMDVDCYFMDTRQKTEGIETSEFSFSNTNSRNKFTEDCWYCTGELLVGTTPAGSKTSALFHAIPALLYEDSLDKPSVINRVFLGCLKQFQEQTAVGSRAALVAGGMYDDDSRTPINNHRKEYLRTIRILSTLNQALLGIDTFVVPPKEYHGQTSLYWNQQKNLAVVIEVKWGERPVSERFDPSHLKRVKCSWNSLVA